MPEKLLVADQREVLAISREMLYAYCGSSQIIAVSLFHRLMEQAFRELSPGEVPRRDQISFLTAFPGRGILECIELVLRLPSLAPQRLVLDVDAGPSEAPAAFAGRFYFEVQIKDCRRGYYPPAAYLDATFRAQVAAWQDKPMNDGEYRSYMEYKTAKARSLASHEGDLFVSFPVAARDVPSLAESWFGHPAYRKLYSQT